jgi:signal transduction histidine kinase/sugar lactone lactonase YvrE
MLCLIQKIIYCLLSLFMLPVALFSRNDQGLSLQDNFPFHNIEYYNSKQGLSGSAVHWAIQDTHGFLWFMTESSLNRFDGYSFRPYSNNFDAKSVNQALYMGLSEDRNGKLWIPGHDQGLYSFDPYQEKFHQYRNQENNPQSLHSNLTTAVAVDGNGDIWVGTTSGLDQFDQAAGLFRHFVHNDNDPFSLTSSFINGIFVNRSNNEQPSDTLWVINYEQSIDCFNIKTGKLIKNYAFPFRPDLLGTTELTVNEIKNNTIWIGSDHERIYGFNIRSKEFIQININHPCKSARHLEGYYSVMEDHAGNLWTSNDNNEIVYYDRSKNEFYFFQVKMNNIKFIDFTGVIFEDRSQKIWFCTNNGLISVDTKQKNIIACQPDGTNPKSISGYLVYGIKRIKQGPLFVCSSTIQVFDKATNSFSPFKLLEDGREIETYGTLDIRQDSKDIIWFSGFSGIISYNPLTKKSHFHLLDTNSKLIDSFFWVGTLRDRNGRYWSVNDKVGLCQFDPGTGKAKIFGANNDPKSIGTFVAGEIFQDSRGIIYLCEFEGGFVTFNPDAGKFKVYHYDVNGNESCHAWIEAKNGLIWFATFGGGIGVFNPDSEKFKIFTSKDGLVYNNVASLIADKNGNYWAATRGGLSCFRPPDDPFAPDCPISFRNYDVSDGLPSNLMNTISAYCDTDGTLLFGTRDAGMFYFHPDDLNNNDSIPPVYITEFRLKNKLVNINDSNSVLKSPIEFTKEIRLNYAQNMISFSFAALNYIHPEKNKYAYMLEGYDKEWVYTDATKRFANYTNLDPDTYIFKVKASNNDGKWNEIPTELKIIITPPFWKTTWFRILVIVAIAGAVYAAYRYRLQQVLKLQKIRNRIAADLHDDIGSTLNSISVYSEVAKHDAAKHAHALEMIGESSRKIIDAMSDIVWTINPDNDSFEDIILRMRSLAFNLLRAKNIEFTFRADESLNDLKLSMENRRNFFLIFKEAINNLVKYAEATQASIQLLNHDSLIKLLIRDNGKGFNTSQYSNGNGLNTMRQRAKDMKAQLKIESESGTGTSIELIMKS